MVYPILIVIPKIKQQGMILPNRKTADITLTTSEIGIPNIDRDL